MQAEETGLQWVLNPSSTLFPKRDSLATDSSAPPAGRAPRAGHAQKARRLRAGLLRLGMRRGRSACGRRSWTEHAHGLRPSDQSGREGRAARSSTQESALHVREVPEKGGSATDAHPHTPAPAAYLSEGLAVPASPTQPPTSPLSCPSGPVQAQGLILAPSKPSPRTPG